MAIGSVQTIGRDAELSRVDAALDGLAGGAPEFLAVEGEPGIGKTRLLAEVRSRAEDRGILVLSGTAAEFERDVPFGVWVDAVDEHVASCDPGSNWDPALLAELEGVLPAARTAGAPGDSSVADERYRAHRAMRGVLELIASEQPAAIVLDDLHWADRASVELVAALLRRGPAAPVLLAFAFRPGQAPERLTAALAAPAVRRVTLGQLSEADASELLGDVDSRSLAAIYRHGGGNPFYLEQLARASSQGRLSGALRHAGDGAEEVRRGRARRGHRGAGRGAGEPLAAGARPPERRRRRGRALRARFGGRRRRALRRGGAGRAGRPDRP